MRASLPQRVALLAAIAIPVAVSLAAYVVVPSFEQMYAPYGSELTPDAHALFATYRWWPLLIVAVILAWLFSSNTARGARLALVVGLVGGFALAGFGWWALQQPHIMLKLIEHG
jgi:hypothetical protein